MPLKITQQKDSRVIRAFTHKLADIPGGVTISPTDLTQAVLKEGTPVGKDSNGLYHVVKVASLTANAAADATVYTVLKGHNFKVGDIIMLALGAAAYAISAISTNASDSAYDDITVGTTLGAAVAGSCIYQSGATGATAGVWKYEPIALVGESYDVAKGDNIIANAWTIGQVKSANIPALGAAVKAALKGIILI